VNDAILPVIVPLLVAVVTYIVAPPLVARIKGTADKETRQHDAELKQLEDWRRARELEHIELQNKYERQGEKLQQVQDEVRELKQRETEHVKQIRELQTQAEMNDQQITNLRNDNYRLMQRLAMMERGNT
jgi:septal ring factor EnvC (AmiA/AmiB activator)